MLTGSESKRCAARALRLAGVIAVCCVVGACSSLYSNHGYVPTQEDLDQIAVGVDTRSSVEETLGSAASSSVISDNAMYFVRSRIRKTAFLEPQVVDREVLAISFDSNGIVANVERFGLEDGQVVPLARRVTDTTVGSRSFLQQLFGNIGSFAPSGLGG
ncbi:outer membrane protein assembly factor BamE [uncultured Roseobacter sp.]|uniref:outer membrane protein assembly factor BamE n=1 Tax=uncultured Roseobacter sp. TaxID=114847 RepID=UPI00262985BE|nr:outer membrane protein assembly factor BamE [uncultured Roseobacter sp.]